MFSVNKIIYCNVTMSYVAEKMYLFVFVFILFVQKEPLLLSSWTGELSRVVYSSLELLVTSTDRGGLGQKNRPWHF